MRAGVGQRERRSRKGSESALAIPFENGNGIVAFVGDREIEVAVAVKSATATALGFVPTANGRSRCFGKRAVPISQQHPDVVRCRVGDHQPGGETTTPLEFDTRYFRKRPTPCATGPVSFAASTNGEFAWATKLPLS